MGIKFFYFSFIFFSILCSDFSYCDVFYQNVNSRAGISDSSSNSTQYLFRIYRRNHRVRLNILDISQLSSSAVRAKLLLIERLKNDLASQNKLNELSYEKLVADTFDVLGRYPSFNEDLWIIDIAKRVDKLINPEENVFRKILNDIDATSLRPIFEITSSNYEPKGFFEPTYVNEVGNLLVGHARAIFLLKANLQPITVRADEIRDRLAFYRRALSAQGIPDDPGTFGRDLSADLSNAWNWGRPPGRSASSWGHGISRAQLNNMAEDVFRQRSLFNIQLMELEQKADQIERQNSDTATRLEKHHLVMLGWLYAANFVKVEFLGILASATAQLHPYYYTDLQQEFIAQIDKERLDLRYDEMPGQNLDLIAKNALAQKIGFVILPFINNQ